MAVPPPRYASGGPSRAIVSQVAAVSGGRIPRTWSGGPIASVDDEDIALLAVEAADENAVQSAFDADPWTVHHVFRIKDVRRWTLWLDGR
jgi:hypothetical protein